MSCSKNSVIRDMISKGLVKQNMELPTRTPDARLADYINHITKLAKRKYNVDMGSLFTVKYRLSKEAPVIINTNLGPVAKLFSNDPAFRAIDESKQAQMNKLKEEENKAKLQALREFQTREAEGQYEINDEGDVVIPKNLPPITIIC